MAAIRTRLSFANVMSVIAVFIALGGSAIAITKIKANSVGSKQIKAKAVKNSDLADNAVTSPKVADGSLQAGDFAAGQLPRGATGPQGPIGPTGTVDTSNFYDKAASDARFLGIGATAQNSSALGGTPAGAVPASTRDVQAGPDGHTKLGFARRTLAAGTASPVTILSVASVGDIQAVCNNPAQPQFLFSNTQTAAADVWLHDLSAAGFIRQTVPGGGTSTPYTGVTTTNGANRAQFLVGSGSTTSGGARVATFDVATETKPDSANTCVFQVQSQSFTN